MDNKRTTNIPDFDANGYLPVGIHFTTFEEVERRFGGSKSLRRSELTKNLKKFFNFIKFHADCLYIDGSYITSKLSPNDVDLLVYFPAVGIRDQQTMARLVYFTKNTKNFNLHIYCHIAGQNDDILEERKAFFQIDRDNNPKGIICIECDR